jgi:hypothetical protein
VLMRACIAHSQALYCHRQGITELAAGEVRAHALAELAYAAAIAERLMAGRSVGMVHALSAGASLEQVGRAAGITGAEVHTALSGWVAGQLRFGFMTEGQAGDVHALLDGGEVSG